MLSLLADAMLNAARQKNEHERNEWADRFVPKHHRDRDADRYRFNPYRDLW